MENKIGIEIRIVKEGYSKIPLEGGGAESVDAISNDEVSEED